MCSNSEIVSQSPHSAARMLLDAGLIMFDIQYQFTYPLILKKQGLIKLSNRGLKWLNSQSMINMTLWG